MVFDMSYKESDKNTRIIQCNIDWNITIEEKHDSSGTYIDESYEEYKCQEYENSNDLAYIDSKYFIN